MTTKTYGIATPADHTNESRVALAARHLYDAELALHDAHQSHVEAWIAAAGHTLHQAVLEHLAVVREQEDTDFEASPADTLDTRELPERRRTARDHAPATQKGTLR